MFVIEKSLIALILGMAIISPLTENPVNAHGGRTNASGCHNDRKGADITVTTVELPLLHLLHLSLFVEPSQELLLKLI